MVVAGNVLHRDAVDTLAAPTTHSSFRAANHVLQPVRCAHHAPVLWSSCPGAAALEQPPSHRYTTQVLLCRTFN